MSPLESFELCIEIRQQADVTGIHGHFRWTAVSTWRRAWRHFRGDRCCRGPRASGVLRRQPLRRVVASAWSCSWRFSGRGAGGCRDRGRRHDDGRRRGRRTRLKTVGRNVRPSPTCCYLSGLVHLDTDRARPSWKWPRTACNARITRRVLGRAHVRTSDKGVSTARGE